jgi:tetrahydromethanopterin:alpha-L-glutamate ligase
MNAPRIALFADGDDGHARRLKRAFARLGIAAVRLSLKDCGFAVFGGGHGLELPGFGAALPDAALVRSVSAGSFEQVTARLGLLHALRELGVPVCNDARAIERCVDKSMTSFLLQAAGLPTPPTWTAESRDAAASIVRREARPDRPLVLKPLFGSRGRGLKLISSGGDLPAAEQVAGLYYLQHFVAGAGPGWRDWRVFVVGGRAEAAMIRHGIEWRTNAALGARCEKVAPEGAIAELAAAAAAAVGADYAGVDIVADRNGRYLALEVNSMPAWSALGRASGIDIAAALARHVAGKLPRWVAPAALLDVAS